MNKEQKIINIVAEILELDAIEVTSQMELNTVIWDSLAVVMFIAEIDSVFDQIVSPSRVSSVKKVAELIDLIK